MFLNFMIMFLLGIAEPDISLKRMSQCLLSCKLDTGFIFSDVANHILTGKLQSFPCNTKMALLPTSN